MDRKWLVLVMVVALLATDLAEAKKKKKKGGGSGAGGGAMTFTDSGPFFSLPITVGSQKTQLKVGVDGYYGASVLFGKSVECDGSDPYCINHDVFDNSMSSSYKEHTAGRHFDLSLGTADGSASSDDLSLGSLKLKDTMFGVADSIPRHLNRKTKNSGFLAMWGPQMKDEDKTTMQMLLEQASSPKITFFAPADMNGQHTITIAGEDTKNCKTNWIDFPSQPSVDKKEQPWTITWNGFKWGSYARTEKMNVAMNVAADYFVAPRRHAGYIYKTLGASYSSRYSGGMVDCAKRNTAPNLEFTVPGGKKLVVTPKHYIKMFDSSNCLINIYPDDLEQWTMPYMFHQKYCVKYDYSKKMVSIADPM